MEKQEEGYTTYASHPLPSALSIKELRTPWHTARHHHAGQQVGLQTGTPDLRQTHTHMDGHQDVKRILQTMMT